MTIKRDAFPRSGLPLWMGEYGVYEIPPQVSALVSRWTKRGWPYKQDKGSKQFLAWVDQQETRAMKEMAAS